MKVDNLFNKIYAAGGVGILSFLSKFLVEFDDQHKIP